MSFRNSMLRSLDGDHLLTTYKYFPCTLVSGTDTDLLAAGRSLSGTVPTNVITSYHISKESIRRDSLRATELFGGRASDGQAGLPAMKKSTSVWIHTPL